MASAIWTIGASMHAYSTSWWCAAMPLMTFIGRLWRRAICGAEGGVWAFHLVVDRLADVVQQAAILAIWTSAPTSAAMMAARRAVSIEWLRTFWP